MLEPTERLPPLSSSETIVLYKLIEQHYHPVPPGPYWAWDKGWSTKRVIKECGITNASKSRLDVIRLQHFGKIEEQRVVHGSPKAAEPNLTGDWIRGVEARLDITQAQREGDLRAAADDHKALRKQFNSHAVAHDAVAKRVLNLEARVALVKLAIADLSQRITALEEKVMAPAPSEQELQVEPVAEWFAETAPNGTTSDVA